jgi:hypothetical protein
MRSIRYTLSAGTQCYGSKRGHYNFYYPDLTQEYELTLKLEVEDLPWVCSPPQYKAVRVINPQDYLPFNVLWILKKPTPV